MEGYLESPMNIVLRVISGIIGVAMLWPHGEWWINIIALLSFFALFIYSRYRLKDSGGLAVATG
jgi:hypothetical protein